MNKPDGSNVFKSIFLDLPETQFVISDPNDLNNNDNVDLSQSIWNHSHDVDCGDSNYSDEDSDDDSDDSDFGDRHEFSVEQLSHSLDVSNLNLPSLPNVNVADEDPDVITTEAIDLETLAPEPRHPDQQYCCLTYAPHLETRTVYVMISGCFGTFEEADQFSQILHTRDPRWNRIVGETGRLMPIPLDRRLFADNPIIRGFDLPVVPFNIISENPIDLSIDQGTENTVVTSEVPIFEVQTNPLEVPSITRMETVPSTSPVIPIPTSVVEDINTNTIDSSSDEEGSGSDDDSNNSEVSPKCIACDDHDRNALLIPCRHLPYCLDCAKIHTKRSNACPICRTPIKEVMNVFF